MRTWGRINRIRTRYELRHTANIERSLRLQIMPVVKALEGQPPEDIIPGVNTLVSDDPVRMAFSRLYVDTGKDFARQTFQEVQGKSLKDEYDDIWMQEMLVFAETKAGSRIASITQTSRDRAIKILKRILSEETFPEGLSVTETRRLIVKAFVDQYIGIEKPYTITGRARVIAKTEVLTASNKGTFIGMESAEATHKTWLTSGIILPDQEPRHVGYPGLEGQKRAIHEPFDVRGYPAMYPGDDSLGMPAGEIVNCSCGMTGEME